MHQTNPHKVAATGQETGSGGVDSNDGGVEVEESLGGTGNAEEVKGGTLGEEFDDFVEEEVVDEPPKRGRGGGGGRRA